MARPKYRVTYLDGTVKNHNKVPSTNVASFEELVSSGQIAEITGLSKYKIKRIIEKYEIKPAATASSYFGNKNIKYPLYLKSQFEIYILFS